MQPTVTILGPILVLATATQSLTGFGFVVVGMTIAAHFFAVEQLVPIMVLISTILNVYLVGRHWREADFRLLLRQVLPLMLLGIAVGTAIFPFIRDLALKEVLGLIVAGCAGRELYLLLRDDRNDREISRLQAGIWQFMAGITHSVFAAGGPMLVYSLGRTEMSKAEFRATLCVVWLTLNTTLTTVFAINGRMTWSDVVLTAYLAPALPLGIIAGHWLHSRISERHFRLFVYCMLTASGLALVLDRVLS